MDLLEISKKLDNLPIGRSKFEFQNFFIDAYPTTARLIAAALIEMENLHIRRMEIAYEIQENNLSESQKLKNHRQLNIIENQLSQLNDWWKTLPENVQNTTNAEFEKQESSYWVKVLAKQAAMELLTTDRTSTGTMTQMSNLDDESFKKSVKLCIEFMKIIKETSSTIESNFGI